MIEHSYNFFYSSFEDENYLKVDSDDLENLFNFCLQNGVSKFYLSPFTGYELESLSEFIHFKDIAKAISIAPEIQYNYDVLNHFLNLDTLSISQKKLDHNINLGNYSNLKKLMFNWMNKQILGFSDLQHLSFLSISHLNSSNKKFNDFEKLSNLKQLYLVNGNIVEFGQFPSNLEKVTISYFSKLEAVSADLELSKIHFLEIESCKKINFEKRLFGSKTLKQLNIINCGEIDNIELVLNLFPNLSEINFSGTTIKS